MTQEMSTRTAVLHPLALSSICDHYTRVKSNFAGDEEEEKRIVGILIGVPDLVNNSVSITDSNDLLLPNASSSSAANKEDEDDFVPIGEQIKRKLYLIGQIFPTYVFIGAYAVSENPNVFIESPELLQEFKRFCENSMFLILNPAIESSSKQLPLKFFDWSASDGVFIEIPFKIHSLESERIAVDEVFNSFPIHSMSSLEVQNDSLAAALDTMNTSVDFLISLLTQMKEGRIPWNFEVMRRLSKLCRQFPTQESTERNFLGEDLDESTLFTTLATYTKSLTAASELTQRYNTTYSNDWSAFFTFKS